MITVGQIRAARALLNLKQSELASKANISLASLNNIERSVTHPRTDTLESIKVSLENLGIEFLPQEGIRKQKEEYKVEIFEGSDAIETWFKNVISTLRKTGEKIVYLSGINDKIFARDYKLAFDNYLNELQKNGCRELVLLKEGDTELYASSDTTSYKWLSEDLFSNVPHAIYGNTYSIITWGPPERLVIIKNQDIADSMKNQFLQSWERSIVPKNKGRS